jgi:hypothetical protein
LRNFVKTALREAATELEKEDNQRWQPYVNMGKMKQKKHLRARDNGSFFNGKEWRRNPIRELALEIQYEMCLENER